MLTEPSVAKRSCGEEGDRCSLCCFTHAVQGDARVGKLTGQWSKCPRLNRKGRVGCDDYPLHPWGCRGYRCLHLTDPLQLHIDDTLEAERFRPDRMNAVPDWREGLQNRVVNLVEGSPGTPRTERAEEYIEFALRRGIAVFWNARKTDECEFIYARTCAVDDLTRHVSEHYRIVCRLAPAAS